MQLNGEKIAPQTYSSLGNLYGTGELVSRIFFFQGKTKTIQDKYTKNIWLKYIHNNFSPTWLDYILF